MHRLFAVCHSIGESISDDGYHVRHVVALMRTCFKTIIPYDFMRLWHLGIADMWGGDMLRHDFRLCHSLTDLDFQYGNWARINGRLDKNAFSCLLADGLIRIRKVTE